MLQAFGTELAETQLSEECSAIEFLLMSHTEKYRRLKVQLNEALVCRECSQQHQKPFNLACTVYDNCSKVSFHIIKAALVK